MLDPLAATHRVLRIIGLRVVSGKPSDGRVNANRKDRFHEACHMAMSLVDGADAKDVAVAPHSSVRAGKLGRIAFRQDDERGDGSLCFPNRVAAVSCGIAGAVGEHLFCDGVDVWGAVDDLFIALARLNIRPDAPGLSFAPLHRIALRTHRVLEMRRDAVSALAKALQEQGQLTRAQAASIAWRADRSPLQFSVPRWDPVHQPDLEAERLRVDSALAELRTWRQERADAAYGEARSREASR